VSDTGVAHFLGVHSVFLAFALRIRADNILHTGFDSKSILARFERKIARMNTSNRYIV
jgi:hypothetical protein